MKHKIIGRVIYYPQRVKNLQAMQETQVWSLDGEDPRMGKIPGWGRSPRREWQHTPVQLPGQSHGQRSLAGYSPWGHRVGLDWQTNTSQYLLGGSVVKNPPVNAGDAGLIPGSERSPGVGNGNPVQYSCLEYSMERGAWCDNPWGHKESDTTEQWTQAHSKYLLRAGFLFQVHIWEISREIYFHQIKYLSLIKALCVKFQEGNKDEKVPVF